MHEKWVKCKETRKVHFQQRTFALCAGLWHGWKGHGHALKKGECRGHLIRVHPRRHRAVGVAGISLLWLLWLLWLLRLLLLRLLLLRLVLAVLLLTAAPFAPL